MVVRISYNDEHGSCVTYDNVYAIKQYNNTMSLFFDSHSEYVKTHKNSICILHENKIKHLKLLFD